jgi:hypothetical protein
MTVIGRMYFIEKLVRIDLHHLSFAQRSYRRAILPEDDPRREKTSDETYAVCDCDYTFPADRRHSDRPRR